MFFLDYCTDNGEFLKKTQTTAATSGIPMANGIQLTLYLIFLYSACCVHMNVLKPVAFAMICWSWGVHNIVYPFQDSK